MAQEFITTEANENIEKWNCAESVERTSLSRTLEEQKQDISGCCEGNGGTVGVILVEMITEIPSVIFRLNSKGAAPDMVILRKHNNKIFITVVKSDLPDAVTSRVAGAVLNFIVEKYNKQKE